MKIDESMTSRPSADDEIDSDRDYVSSLARGLDVICAFTRFTPKMTLSDVARATGMTRATARRLLLTLVREGYFWPRAFIAPESLATRLFCTIVSRHTGYRSTSYERT